MRILRGDVAFRTCVLMVGALLPAGWAAAQAKTTGSASIVSDYAFRGVSQSNLKPAFQVGMEHQAGNGIYVGTWGSNISWLSDLSTAAAPISSSLEVDVYGGHRGNLSRAWSYEVGLSYYGFPGNYPAGFKRADTIALHGGLDFAATPDFTVGAEYKYSHALAVGWSGTGYLELSASWRFRPGWTLDAHAGKQWIKRKREYQYSDWKLGVTRRFENGFLLGLAYVGTNANAVLYTNAFGRNIAKDRLVMKIGKEF
ncbi:hypothetical protein EBB59_09265 [Lysobacter pythonis]|uniref:Uncharacterized protein n=1 Tax=Solilutibacter pythonis TaxID=2483112 RepID=A0A3M2HYP1_9GAMM|nr:TorF family putative porin [Lysobacter pythonis]RMH90954.1 hypothetical protein EBB59_09265 [Lysobacter pythonis]